MQSDEIKPPDYDIDAAYDRLRDATLGELSPLLPGWNFGTFSQPCQCEFLVLRSHRHPTALMIAAGRVADG